MAEVSIRVAAPPDAALLSSLGWETFLDTFVHEFQQPYPQADLDAFYPVSYAPEVTARLLADPQARAWLAESDGVAVGFATAGRISRENPESLPHEHIAPGDGELKRLYLRREAQGTGLATRLMDEALSFLDRDGRRPVWLGVWSQNHRAQRFYARYGFVRAGEYEYPVGAVRDREFILHRPAGGGTVAA